MCSALMLAVLMLFAGCGVPASRTSESAVPESSESQPESLPAEGAAETEEPKTEDPVVETGSGKVAGVYEDGIAVFKGIPYAAPPVGELRFAPPQPVEAWEDVLDCSQFKDSPLQAKADEGLTYSEDCLYLNIWTPEDAAGKNLPVLVFIHGGAYAQGSPNKPLYSGTRFA